MNNLRSQFAISSWGGLRYLPMAFTEQGVAIVRVYTRMRQLMLDNKELWQKIEKIEMALSKKDEEVQTIFKELKKLLVKEETPREPIGFKIPKKK